MYEIGDFLFGEILSSQKLLSIGQPKIMLEGDIEEIDTVNETLEL